jgi:hypothetical protein
MGGVALIGTPDTLGATRPAEKVLAIARQPGPNGGENQK